MKKYCQKCNKVFDEQKKYCPYCGSQLIEKEESIVKKEEDEKEQEIENPDDTIHYITLEEIVSFKYNSIAKVFLLPVTINIIKAIIKNKTPPVISIPGIVINQSKLNVANIITSISLILYIK